jgi:hypothetical protein
MVGSDLRWCPAPSPGPALSDLLVPRKGGRRHVVKIRKKGSCVLAGRMGLAAVLALLSGCSSPERESSLEEATVTGTVKVRGKLLSGGELNFSAVNPNRKVQMRKATIGKDGTYTAKAYIGANLVTVTPPKPKDKKEGKEFFGVGYEERSVTVKSGENQADLEFLPD